MMSRSGTRIRAPSEIPPALTLSKYRSNPYAPHTISERRNICFIVRVAAASSMMVKQMFLLSLIVCLILLTAGLMVVPIRVLWTAWFTGALALGDTALTSYVIYLSGNASSDLYLSYFTIMLLAAATRTMKQMFLLSLIVCGAYGLLLYFDSVRAGGISEGALIRVPLLLIMAIFYGVTTETVRRAGQ